MKKPILIVVLIAVLLISAFVAVNQVEASKADTSKVCDASVGKPFYEVYDYTGTAKPGEKGYVYLVDPTKTMDRGNLIGVAGYYQSAPDEWGLTLFYPICQ